MGRSRKKGPYVHQSLWKKIEEMNDKGEKRVVKTLKRSSMILPEFVGHTVAIHNGKKFVPIYCTETMVGHRLGEFAATRTFKGHSGAKAVALPGAPGAAPGAAPAGGAAPAAAGAKK